MKMIIENKVKLIDWLRADSVFILQHVHSKRIVTDREYQELKSFSVPEAAVTNLIDKMILKKEETCSQFLDTLKESEVKDTYPELKKNRTALVSQVKNVKAIVDDLQSGGCHDEMAANVNAQLTPQEMMRKLLDSATSTGAANALIQALLTHQKDVMDDLIAENA
uniref:CARD domain-containing protein n=1 Tax=Oncorhynchus mykiss TaxID=8022 RepID=A0A8K9UXJ0_ONCMY